MLPCSRTTAFDTDPFTSIDNSITAPDPVVVLIVSVGLNLYPLPASETNTDLIFPSSIVGTSVAVFTVPTPTNCKSFSVSTVTSYKPVAVKGAGSDLVKLDKSTSSTIKFEINVLLILSIACFKASCLFLNQLCLGCINVPYFNFSLNSGSGT